ncbi:MAG: phosphate signaling complex protein PhoU [Alphaproteobacteria bacterium]|nr:phosphate signaling complex protein PhoU [Alphaproteobacteria bacterium]MBE8219962.1 phosphate signaling complex protein PhoU [Alphaproteobacteria bacterium]
MTQQDAKKDESHEHIASAFDRDLKALNDLMNEIGEKALSQLRAAIALCDEGGNDESQDNPNTPAIETRIATIIAGDKEIDNLEAALNEKVVEVIARRAPMAQDLRSIIAALKVAAALERIGDYAKNIAKRMRVILQAEKDASNPQIYAMGEMVCAMLADVMTAYRDIDADLAMAVRNRDVEVDKLHTDIFRTLLSQMDSATGAHDNSTNLHFLFIAKNTERMGDYVTGIAEQIYFLKCGTLPDDERPKADKSSSPKS